MSPSTVRSPEDLRNWRGWIAENILGGADPRELQRMMIGQGFSPDESEHELVAAISSPYLEVAQRLGVGASAAPRGTSTARAVKYEWWMEVQRRTARLASNHGVVPRIARPSDAAFLDDYYAANRPCLIEGAIADWPALERWTPEYLKAACGDQMVEVEGNRNATSATSLNKSRSLPFGDFVDIVHGSAPTNDWYMTAQNDSEGNGKALSALWDDVRLPSFLTNDRGPVGGAFVWYGPAGTLSSTHHDLTNNLMAQVIGRKRVWLVAPSESAHLSNDFGRRSLVSLETPDLRAYPALADVTIMEVDLGPGDLLFLPAGWWHSVRALDPSFTFTFTNFVYDANDYYALWSSDESLDD